MLKPFITGSGSGWFLAAGLTAVFLLMELPLLGLPGLNCEETQNAVKIVPLVSGLRQGSGLRNVMMHWPLREGEYHYSFSAYLLMPFFLILGVSVFALRLMPVVLAAVSFLVFYQLLKILFDKNAAILTLLLLIVNPAFIMETKLGNEGSGFLSLFAFSAFLCFLLWTKERKPVHFFCGAFFLGLGFITRLWFLWFMLAFVLLGTVFSLRRPSLFWGSPFRKKVVLLSIGAAAFLIGAWLFSYDSIINGFPLLKVATARFHNSLTYGKELVAIDHAGYLKNMLICFENFNSHISGSFSFMRQFRVETGNYFYVVLFWSSCLWVLLTSLLCKRMFFSRSAKAFMVFLFILMFLQTPVTLVRVPGIHFLLFYPLVQIIQAVALVEIFYMLRWSRFLSRIATAAAVVVMAALFSLQIQGLNKYYRLIKDTCGVGLFSDAVYSLDEFFVSNGVSRVTVCSWGAHNLLDIISSGRVLSRCYNLFEVPLEDRKEYLKNMISGAKDNFFVFLSPEFARVRDEDLSALLKETAGVMGKEFSEVKRISQRDGETVYLVYSVK